MQDRHGTADLIDLTRGRRKVWPTHDWFADKDFGQHAADARRKVCETNAIARQIKRNKDNDGKSGQPAAGAARKCWTAAGFPARELGKSSHREMSEKRQADRELGAIKHHEHHRQLLRGKDGKERQRLRMKRGGGMWESSPDFRAMFGGKKSADLLPHGEVGDIDRVRPYPPFERSEKLRSRKDPAQIRMEKEEAAVAREVDGLRYWCDRNWGDRSDAAAWN